MDGVGLMKEACSRIRVVEMIERLWCCGEFGLAEPPMRVEILERNRKSISQHCPEEVGARVENRTKYGCNGGQQVTLP
jgi:hypothetical protein